MKKINIVFMVCFFIILLGGFIKPVIKPKDFNYDENRDAYKLPKVSLGNIIDKSFQDNIELALSDQIPLATKMKLAMKTIILYLNYHTVISESNKHQIYYNGLLMYKGSLLYYPRSLEDEKSSLDNKIKNYNNIINKNKDINYYMFYIEKDTDIDFTSNEKVGLYDYIDNYLSPKIKRDVFRINNIDEFDKYFYDTDHHWNNVGSYDGYLQIVQLMNLSNPITYSSEICLKTSFRGSKSSSIGAQYLFNEKPCFYNFNLPEHKVFINNKEGNYGNYKNYINSNPDSTSYGDLYGSDYGLIEFDYGSSEKNLLILGESYDNAINELIASHYNKTYNIDLRAYKLDIGKEFNFDKFIKDKKISDVLLIGNIDYYTLDTFMIGDGK